MNPIQAFVAYARVNEPYRDAMMKHLSPFVQLGWLQLWYDRLITPGADWDAEIQAHLDEAELFLLLVSADFIDSAYAMGVECQRALQLHAEGRARVIPILVEPCVTKSAPFDGLLYLPSGKKAVLTWQHPAEAWTDVAEGIERVMTELRQELQIA